MPSDTRLGEGTVKRFCLAFLGRHFWKVQVFYSKRIRPNWPKVEFDEIYLIHPDSVASGMLGCGTRCDERW